jgi:hypothetical protein
MGSEQVWRARLDEPHPKSYLAFILGLHGLVERVDGPQPVVWDGPVDLEKVPGAKRAYWEHWNPVLTAFEDAMRSAVNERLVDVLRPGLSCDHPDVRPLADVMLEGHREQLRAEHAMLTQRSEPILARYPIKPVWAFVYFIKSGVRPAMPGASENAVNTKVAEYLSQGIPSGHARKFAVTRNHVDRACKGFLRSLGGRVNSSHTRERRDRIIEATFLMWSTRLETIETIARAASREKMFRGKTGADLVAAIEQVHGVHRIYYRVLEGEHLKRRA